MNLHRVLPPPLPLIIGWKVGNFKITRHTQVIEENYFIPGNIFDTNGELVASVTLENNGIPNFGTNIGAQFQIFYMLPTNNEYGFWAM